MTRRYKDRHPIGIEALCREQGRANKWLSRAISIEDNSFFGGAAPAKKLNYNRSIFFWRQLDQLEFYRFSPTFLPDSFGESAFKGTFLEQHWEKSRKNYFRTVQIKSKPSKSVHHSFRWYKLCFFTLLSFQQIRKNNIQRRG